MAMGNDVGIRELVRVGLTVYGCTQDPVHRIKDLCQRLLTQLVDPGLRMNSDLEKDFVGIDVADASQDPLVHQSRFHYGPSPAKGFLIFDLLSDNLHSLRSYLC
jgi:hypothetical protein